ncbi:MAG: hypothetical protein JJU07_01590 [Natronohydrobacter sp.]|nr:hypothetical protein [Natronohydrobacter sp.]
MTRVFRGLFVTLITLLTILPLPRAAAETLALSGVLQNAAGQPLPGHRLRIVFGSDQNARLPDTGYLVQTDARGRFALDADVTLKSRRVRLDSVFARHPSQLLEIGFELALMDRPALHWVELDFIAGYGPLRGIRTYVAGRNGRFTEPLVFHSRDHAWSVPGDPSGLRITGTGTDVQVESWDEPAAGRLRLVLRVIHEKLVMR